MGWILYFSGGAVPGKADWGGLAAAVVAVAACNTQPDQGLPLQKIVHTSMILDYRKRAETVLNSQSYGTELTRGPSELVQHFRL
jgi:hypothetical protein